MRFRQICCILLLFLAAAFLTACGTGVEDGQTPTHTNGEAITDDSLPGGETTSADSPIRLKVMIAGSLIAPFGELEKAYEALHPEIDVEVEAHGSIQVIRHVTEIGDLVDVVVPADDSLIPMLMYTTEVPDTGEVFAEWYLEFATNRMALAWRGVAASALMMWGRGISEFGAIVILAYHPKIIPVLVFERFSSFGLDAAQPVAVVLILASLVVFMLVSSLLARRE